MHIEDFDIGEIPLYNDDIYTKGFPAAVESFRTRITVKRIHGAINVVELLAQNRDNEQAGIRR